MTPRTPSDIPPRSPQRISSNTLLSDQLPTQQWLAEAHRYLPVQGSASPSTIASGASESSADSTPARLIATPLRTGSRLKMEMLQDIDFAGSASNMDSPQNLTPWVTGGEAINPYTSNAASPATSRASHRDFESQPMPMPRRRGRLSSHSQNNQSSPESVTASTTTLKKEARPKPYSLDVPQWAPRLMATNKDTHARNEIASKDPFSRAIFSGHADFFKWTGHHHEDGWSIDAITKGTWDKATSNETSSAKLAVFPALKQKSGLNALSTIFMGVLSQRRHRGTITAASTFKPPPRVTLTDTKREIWLKDLSNPAISLRKLSRTIPHGIRGRTLLDQCLNKIIPVERAAWLAKCVGANEIRAFKRKGVSGAFVMGGESKWIRDWTVFVEQFIEGIISNPGSINWRDKVNYCIRLATHLYGEQLLDREHYLEWILSGLENSPLSKIPVWILIVKIYWTDLLQAHRTGRRFAAALLSQLDIILKDQDKDIFMQLSGQLAHMLTQLCHASPQSLITPAMWPKHRDVLKAMKTSEDIASQVLYDNVDSRNMTLLAANPSQSPAGCQHVVKLLDSTLQGTGEEELSKKCWATSEDKTSVVRVVIQWATSAHRPGIAKVYTAVNLIRSWSVYRIDSTRVILDILDEIPAHDYERKALIYHLVMELARTQHFFFPQYFQWLIARGGYHNAWEIDPKEGSCATRLLVEVPTHELPETLRNERAGLLRRAGYSVAAEYEDVSMAWSNVKHVLGLPLSEVHQATTQKATSLNKLVIRLAASNLGLRSYVGSSLRNFLFDLPPSKASFLQSEETFISVRKILESIQDYSMLAEVVRLYSIATDLDVLASCTDTVNANFSVFKAVEAENDLFRILLERLRASQGEGLAARPLLVSLSNLAQRMPHHIEIAMKLHTELVKNDQSNAINACSPISDNMIGTPGGPNDELSDEIDKLLASGNTIDNQTMKRLFRNIIPKLETGWTKQDDDRLIYASLLTKLRIFDTQYFDKIMADWICHLRSMPVRPPLLDIFPILVSFGSLSVGTLLQTSTPITGSVARVSDDSTYMQGAATYLQDLLQLLIIKLPSSTCLSAREAYRYRIYQQSAKLDHTKGLALLIRNAIMEYTQLAASKHEISLPLDHDWYRAGVLDALKTLVVLDSTAVTDAFNAKSLCLDAATLFHGMTTKLLIPDVSHNAEITFDEILGLSDELTMPFCRLKLNAESSLAQLDHPMDHTKDLSQFELFAKAIDHAIEAKNIMWTTMLPCISDDVAQRLRSEAQNRFLDLIPSLKSPAVETEVLDTARIQLAKNLLGVVEAIVIGQPMLKAASLSTVLVDKTQDLWALISSGDTDLAKLQPAVLQNWLPLLLEFLVLQSTASELLANTVSTPGASAKPTPHHNRASLVLILSAVFLHLTSSFTDPPLLNLAQRTLDVAIVFADLLPEDVRYQCAKAILVLPKTRLSAQACSDPRLYYLLSIPQLTTLDNFILSHKDKSGTPHIITTKNVVAMYGIGPPLQERLSPFSVRRWELLSEPTPVVSENDTSLNLGLFAAIKI